VLEKALYIENKQPVRKAAFELLLSFLEQVYSREEAQIDLLGASIDLTPFTVEYRDKVNLPVHALQAPDRTSVLVPSGTAVPSVEDSVQLFEILLHHISDSPTHFEFWFRSLKEHYLSVFYPQVVHGDQKVGFRPHAPAVIQEVFLPHLDRWMRNPDLSKTLWGDAENKQLLLEIYCQSCHLPVSFEKTIKKSITLFRMVFVESPPKEIADSVIEYRQLFLQKLPTIFSAETPLQSVTTHVSLCLEVLQVFKYMFAEAYETLSPETQEVLLYTLLNTSTELLAPSSPNPILAEALAAVCIDTILFIWIRTKSEKPEHWQALQDGIAGLFHSMETIETLKVKVVQLTLVICNKIYPVKWKEKKKRKTGGMQQKAKAQRILGSPDTVPAPKLPAPDPAITMMQWNVDEILHVWNNMLNIFSKVNQIKDPKIHKVAINVLTEIIEIVSGAEAAVPFIETLEGR
jgi:RALGAPB N-terminal domain